MKSGQQQYSADLFPVLTYSHSAFFHEFYLYQQHFSEINETWMI